MKKNSNGYIPSPLSIKTETFPPGIFDLAEMMAENIHEVWSAQKMNEGWTYGETLNPLAKQHPSLKPYADLDESQKAYDRNTAMATLGFIIGKGYIIEKR